MNREAATECVDRVNVKQAFEDLNTFQRLHPNASDAEMERSRVKVLMAMMEVSPSIGLDNYPGIKEAFHALSRAETKMKYADPKEVLRHLAIIKAKRVDILLALDASCLNRKLAASIADQREGASKRQATGAVVIDLSNDDD
jgi:hypothetical protein